MAIVFDNAAQHSASTNDSFSYTNAGNFLFIEILTNNNTTTPAVTYNGVSATFLSGISTSFNFVYYLYTSATGANTLAVSVTPTGSVTRTHVSSYKNVAGSAPDATGSATGTSATATVSLTTTATNDWLLAYVSFGGAGGAPVSSGGSTMRVTDATDAEGLLDSTSGVGAPGSHSIASGSGDAGSHSWSIFAIAISPLNTVKGPFPTHFNS